MENNLPSILGGMAQGFTDFGKGLFDMFGTGGASVLDLIESAKTGRVTSKNQDDFRKWLYQTDSTKDAAAKGLGTALNGVQTVVDYIPGVNAITQSPLGNAAQGALGGIADELKTYGEDYDMGRAGQRALVSGGAALVSGGLGDALKKSASPLMSSGTIQGLAKGATGGAITGGGYAAIDGGDVLQAAKQGAGMGALIGGATGLAQDFKPAKTYDVGLTDEERASRLKEVRKMRNAIGSEKAYMSGALDEASENRWSELYNLEQAYKNGFDSYNDYHNTLRPTKGLDDETLGLVLKNMEEPELQPWMQKGSHQPTFDPTMSSLASSMDRTVSGESFMPDDFYQHMDWYGGGDTKPYLESASAIQKIRGNPNAKVTMYRATVGDKIYPNDWVTLSPEYARQHLANALRDQPDAKIIKQTVAARDLRWPGDDINEFGYYPITNGDIAKVKALETTLADADMAVNGVQASKIAPGQLGLFDDMPTQAPKTGTRQTSLFDQPDNPYLDYYGADIDTTPLTPEAPANPYAPVNGEVTQAMRDRAADVLGNWKKNGVPENELYNAINQDTLPDKVKSLKEIVDGGAYDKRMKELFGTTDIKKADIGKVIDYLYESEPARADNIKNNLLAERGLGKYEQRFRNRMKKSLYEAAQERIANDIGANGLTSSKNIGDISIRRGYTAAADEALSERLGIAPGNTPKYNGAMDTRNAYGRYSHPSYREGGDLAVFERKMNDPEDAISTVAHERLHSFQGELEPRSKGRYDKEVLEAYEQLRNDLAPHYKSWDETAERYGHSGTAYWQSTNEQESRMLQNYLENKGYTDSTHMKSKYRTGEWGNEINPAFDKFFDKLRDLSKRGVALPALAALFGGGAYMASQENDKEKEVK